MNIKIQLKSGRSIFASEGIIGISPELKPTEGYDGTLEGAELTCPEHRDPEEWEPLTREERLELAEIMIERWKEYRDKASC